MGYYFFELFINFYQGFLMIYFMNRRLPAKKEYPKWADVGFVFLIAAGFSLYLLFDIKITDVWIFVIPFFYAVYTKRETWLSRAFWTLILALIFNFVVGIAAGVYSTLTRMDIETVMQSTYQRIGWVVAVNLSLTIVVFFIANMGKSKGDNLIPGSFIWIICPILILLFAATELIFMIQWNGTKDQLLIAAHGCIFVAAVGMIAFYTAVSSFAQNRHDEALLKNDSERLSQFNTEMAAYYEKMLVLQHDLHNQVNAAARFIGDTNSAEYKQWIGELKALIEDENPFLTGNIAVDAIISSKRLSAEQRGILFRFDPYPLAQTPIDEVEFCNLLTNLLDNALEGAMRAAGTQDKQAFVEFRMNKSWDMFYINVSNSCAPDTVIKTEGGFETSKADKRLHGLGTKSIRQIVSKHQGLCNFTVNGDIFEASIVFQIAKRN